MKDFLLTEIIKDAGDFCEWCTLPCKDEDKYEMLIICINIQRECLLICRTVNSILGVSDFMKRVIEIFEMLSEDVRRQSEAITSKGSAVNKSFRRNNNAGCSHIFSIARLLEQSYLNSSYNSD
jgi:hypothetical protein